MINLSTAFKTSAIQQTSDGFILDTFKDEGRENSIIFSVSRNATNNFIDPSDGSKTESLTANFRRFPRWNETIYGDHPRRCILPPY